MLWLFLVSIFLQKRTTTNGLLILCSCLNALRKQLFRNFRICQALLGMAYEIDVCQFTGCEVPIYGEIEGVYVPTYGM
jgi:hypothetical protein